MPFRSPGACRSVAIAGFAVLSGCATPVAPLAVRIDFADPQVLSRFACTDASVFRCAADGDRPRLQLVGASHYQPPHRSPLALAILRDAAFGDFDLEVQCRQTGREYPHRDLVVVFGWRDAAHFAYAHLASTADANAHHLQLVDGRDRQPVTTSRSQGVAWGEGWHTVRVQRRGSHVEVWFDGGAAPVLVGEVPAWTGGVGLGSFDDTGEFTGLTVAAR